MDVDVFGGGAVERRLRVGDGEVRRALSLACLAAS